MILSRTLLMLKILSSPLLNFSFLFSEPDDDDNEVEAEESNIFPIRHDKSNSVSSRNLIVGKNEYTNLTSPSSFTNTTNVDKMDSVLNGTAILGSILEVCMYEYYILKY